MLLSRESLSFSDSERRSIHSQGGSRRRLSIAQLQGRDIIDFSAVTASSLNKVKDIDVGKLQYMALLAANRAFTAPSKLTSIHNTKEAPRSLQKSGKANNGGGQNTRDKVSSDYLNDIRVVEQAEKKRGGRVPGPRQAEHSATIKAYALEKLGRSKEAIEAYGSVVDLGGDVAAVALYNRSMLLYRQGDTREAIEDLTKAFSLDPENPSVLWARSAMYRSQSEFMRATEDLNTLAVRSDEMLANSRFFHEDSEILAWQPNGSIHLDDQLSAPELAAEFAYLSPLSHLSEYPALLRQLADSVAWRKHTVRETLHKKGEEAMCLHIVVKGTVVFLQPKTPGKTPVVPGAPGSPTSSNNSLTKATAAGGDAVEVYKTIEKWGTFGEIAFQGTVLNPTRYEEHAVAKTNVLEVCISSGEYAEVMLKYDEMKIRQRIVKLKACPAFRTWENLQLRYIASRAQEVELPAGSVALKYCEPVTHLCLILRGLASVEKPIPYRNTETRGCVETDVCSTDTPERGDPRRKPRNIKARAGPSFASPLDTPGRWLVSESCAEARIQGGRPITIGNLGSLQVFGELAVLTQSLRPALSPVSIICQTAVDVLQIKREDMSALGAVFNAETVSYLQTGLNIYNPPRGKVRHYDRIRREWESDRATILAALRPPKTIDFRK